MRQRVTQKGARPHQYFQTSSHHCLENVQGGLHLPHVKPASTTPSRAEMYHGIALKTIRRTCLELWRSCNFMAAHADTTLSTGKAQAFCIVDRLCLVRSESAGRLDAVRSLRAFICPLDVCTCASLQSLQCSGRQPLKRMKIGQLSPCSTSSSCSMMVKQLWDAGSSMTFYPLT